MNQTDIRDQYRDPRNPKPGDAGKPTLPRDMQEASVPPHEQDNRGVPRDPNAPEELPEGVAHGRIKQATDNPATDPIVTDGLPPESTVPFTPSQELAQEAKQGNPVAIEEVGRTDGTTETHLAPDAVKPGDGLGTIDATGAEGTVGDRGVVEVTDTEDGTSETETKADLYKQATELEIAGRGGMTKDELAAAIAEAKLG